MKLAEPCISCKSNTTCDCLNVLVRFYNLLEGVRLRILTTKVASEKYDQNMDSAGIDKLNAYFSEPLEIAEIIRKAKAHNFTVEKTRLESKNQLKISCSEEYIHFTLDISQTHFKGFISNPNRFKNWPSYVLFLEKLLDSEVIRSAKIQRLDLNVDFFTPYNEIVQRIDMKNKSTEASYESKRGQRTGIYIGKGSEQLLIYDKSIKDNLSNPRSRIELRLKEGKIKCHSIYDIPESLRKNNYFCDVEGVDVVQSKSILTHGQNLKLQEFMGILVRDGFYSARKSMNKSRNFDRDFAGILKIAPWSNQPSELFNRKIKLFLDPHVDLTKFIYK